MITGGQALAITEAHYVGGASPERVREWISSYPPTRYWWSVVRDF
jgi:hypothetical protein